MEIKLTSAVIFVKDIQNSRRFYEEVLGQKVLMDHGPNVGYEGGFALWQRDHASQIIFNHPASDESVRNNNAELYFETFELDNALLKLQAENVAFIHPMLEQPWGQRVFRFYDPDGHIIELGEPMPAVIQRFLAQGLTAEAIAERTFMPLEIVKQLCAM
ncbi:MAG: VOC family protein [Anaerolineae bacterium]|nr:VOC family protein [Anaerolineae bacterium]